MKRIVLLSATLFFITHLHSQNISLDKRLSKISGIETIKIEVPSGYKSAYELHIEQPIDHQHPEKGKFYQKVYLSHLDFSKPTVIVTEGYDCQSNYVTEVARLLDANQIVVEHRYFGFSCPDSLDYSYLNLEQETADLHAIRKIFKDIYPNQWISTGISKGGQTTLFYRYFYPEDVSVSIPYVAPFNLSLEDKRIYHFFDTVGTPECRKKIEAFQRLALEKRDSILPILRNYGYENDYNFTYIQLEQAFEYTVLEYSFSFWQWGHNCSLIPSETANVRQILTNLLTVIDIGFFSDEEIDKYGSHYYQAASEMGYYGYDIQDFDTLIKTFPGGHNPLATFTPGKMYVHFDSTLVYKAFDWLETKGNNIIYIYGGSDTWSATSLPVSDKTNSVWFYLKGRNHGDARISNMSENELLKLKTTLDNWLKTDINIDRMKSQKQTRIDE
jgi:hypothetical protein